MNSEGNNRVESPCIRNCCLDENDICLGCFRSLTEIMQWTLVDENTRLDFLNNSIKRKNSDKKSVGRVLGYNTCHFDSKE